MPDRPRQHRPFARPGRKTHGAPRQSPSKRGYGRRHQAWRLMVLARSPICSTDDCNEVATEAHHLTPISRGGEQYAMENGRALCKRCHSRTTATEDGGFGR